MPYELKNFILIFYMHVIFTAARSLALSSCNVIMNALVLHRVLLNVMLNFQISAH